MKMSRNKILIPDYYILLGYVSVALDTWEAMVEEIKKTSNHIMWGEKKSKIFWRGALSRPTSDSYFTQDVKIYDYI